MFSSTPIEINKSSLVSLKAEILRKQQELKSKPFDRPISKPIVTKKKKKKTTEKTEAIIVDDDEDRELLAKSKQMLENKTKLYNALSKGGSKLSDKELEISKRTLVQFDKKDSDEELGHNSSEEYEAKNPDDEWVEYVDALGRTRKCLHKDLEYMKRKDRDLSDSIEGSGILREEPKKFIKQTEKQPKEDTTIYELSDENELLSSDMRREILRREWEKQEEELMNRKNIHYQDVLFNEARSHGVGYYAFSQNKDERVQQQQKLKKLREETLQQQKSSSELKVLREKQLATRLKAARNRKRARMGLPPEEDEPEKQQNTTEKDDEEEKRKQADKEVEEKRKQEERSNFVRPWDIGKEILKKHYEYSQEEWVHKKREERPRDFAPPSFYRYNQKPTENDETDQFETKKSLFFTSKKDKSKKEPFRKNINPYIQPEQSDDNIQYHKRSNDEENSTSKKRKIQLSTEKHYVSPFNFPTESLQPSYDVGVTLSEKNESVDKDTFLEDERYDRYSPSHPISDSSGDEEVINNVNTEKGLKIDPVALEESVMAGLRYLREKSEKKTKKYRDEDII